MSTHGVQFMEHVCIDEWTENRVKDLLEDVDAVGMNLYRKSPFPHFSGTFLVGNAVNILHH